MKSIVEAGSVEWMQKEGEVFCRENVNAPLGNWIFLSAASTTFYCNAWQTAKTPIFRQQLALPFFFFFPPILQFLSGWNETYSLLWKNTQQLQLQIFSGHIQSLQSFCLKKLLFIWFEWIFRDSLSCLNFNFLFQMMLFQKIDSTRLL